MALSDWLYEKTDATHRIALDRLAVLVASWLKERGVEAETIDAALGSDHAGQMLKPRHVRKAEAREAALKADALPQRQARHLTA
jgi:hypothetical protein